MKWIWIALFASFSAIAQEYNFDHGGYNRIYLVHLPTGYDANNQYPLVLAFHGGLGKGSQLENQSQLSVKADQEGFVVVYPDGVPFGILNIRTWNGGHCCGGARDNNVNDVGFVDNLLDTLMKNYSIDADRVYATGISNGGFMSYKLACDLPNRFAAIAPVAATMGVDNCGASSMVPVCQVQSKVDYSIPYQGGVGSGLSNHYNPPLDSVLNVWALKGNCNTVINGDSTGFSYREHKDCDCGKKIEYYLTDDGGHSWAGGKKATGDTVSVYVNANDRMWEFFKKHTISCNVSNLLAPDKFEVQLYVAGKEVKWQLEGNKTAVLELIDLEGKQVFSGSISSSGSLQLSDLATGVYIARVVQGNQVISRKLLLSK